MCMTRRGFTAFTLLSLSIAGSSMAAAPASQPMALPFSEQFATASLAGTWKSDVAKGNTVEVKDGTLQVRARAGTRAHIERPLNVDLVRISCDIRPISGATNAALVLHWDQQNFCEIGVSTQDAHRIQVREVLGTYIHKYDLGPWPAGTWHGVAIELGKDCIRYLHSGDGREFKALRISRRPERFASLPAVLIVGEGRDGKVFPRPDPFIDPPVADAAGTASVRNIQVEQLDPNRHEASPEERFAQQADERDMLGEQEMASQDDPTFDSVGRHYPPLRWPREAIGIKDHPHAIGVAHDGALQFTDNSAGFKEPRAFFEIGEPVYRFATGSTPCGRRLLKGYMPIVILTDRHDGLELEQTAFGYARDFSPEEELSAYVRFTVTNPGEAARNTKVTFRLHPLSEKSSMLSWQLDVPAHASRSVDLRAPFAIVKSPAIEVPAQEFDTRLAEVVERWDKLLATGSRFEIPEQRVQNAYRAWMAYNFINVHKCGDVYHVCDGSGFYTKMYGYSVALNCNALDLLGYHELAVRNFDSLLTCMQPSGLLAVNFGDTDTGAALYSMSEHYRITRDDKWLRRMAPKMLAMCNWIIEQRKKTLAQAATQPAVTKGLIRYRPYADLLTPAADYFSNGYLCKGLAATAEVFAEIGMNEEATRLKEAGEAYRKDIATSMEAAIFTDGGMKILPAIPDTRELWKESNGSANGYYSIIAQCMLDAGAPAWDDPKAQLLIDALRRRGGLTLGIPRFHDLVDHAYSYGYWMNCLQRGEVKPAILGLYASMAYGMTRDTYSAVECTAIRSGENYWTLPHTYSNTQQLRLLRHMLLREEGDELLIGCAIPRPWLGEGRRVAVKEAPTLFGPASFVIESGADRAKVHVDPPTRGGAHTVKIRLRHPSRRDINTVECQPKVALNFKGDVVELRGLDRPVDLKVQW